MADRIISNGEIADILDRIAELMQAQDGNPHRVRAYRNGAMSVRDTPQQISDWVKDGDEKKLQDLPGIGAGLARVISTYVKTGQSNILDRLQGEVTPEALFAQVPGLGPELAQRIVKKLDVNTLEELEQAAHDGRLGSDAESADHIGRCIASQSFGTICGGHYRAT